MVVPVDVQTLTSEPEYMHTWLWLWLFGHSLVGHPTYTHGCAYGCSISYPAQAPGSAVGHRVKLWGNGICSFSKFNSIFYWLFVSQ